LEVEVHAGVDSSASTHGAEASSKASSEAAGLVVLLGPHLSSLAAGFAEASTNVDEFCDLG